MHAFLSGLSPASIILIASLISVAIEILKKYTKLNGKVIIVINAVASIAALLAASDAAHFWTLATWMPVLQVFLAAAGIHATAKGLFPPASTAGSPIAIEPTPISGAPISGTKVMLLVLGLGMLAGTSGCKTVTAGTPATAPTLPKGAVDQVDAHANEVLQAIHGFLASVSHDVLSGKLTLSAPQLVVLNRCNLTTNQADAAEQAYHAAGGGSASILTAAISAAQSSFTSLQGSIAGSLTAN